MRFSPLALILIIAALSWSCNNHVTRIGAQTPPVQQPTNNSPYPDGAARITIADLQEKIKKNEAFILDVRNQAAYDMGHIPESKMIPSGEILEHLDELPTDKLIVTYCSCPNEHTAAAAVIALKSKNITNAAALLGGFNEWQKEALLIDKKPQ
jgi:rhodanese-related sulfurtransferase